MAKLFYTLEEAAERLGKSEADIKEMVESGRLQEFRDRDRLMFKRDQVDLLAPHDDDILSSSKSGSGAIPLAESGELGAIPLASDSGTGIPLESPKEQTGISIFEGDQTEEAGPSAVTQITETTPGDLQLETMGSGSPFHGALGHRDSPLNATRGSAAARRSQLWSMLCRRSETGRKR